MVLEYLLLPHLDAITLLKETVAHYSKENTDVYCALVDLSKAYDRIDASFLCDKLKATNLPGQTVKLIEFVGKKPFCLHFL